MSLADLLQNTQKSSAPATIKPTVKTSGLSGLLSTAVPNTNSPAVTPVSLQENPKGSGFPALKTDGTPFTPVSTVDETKNLYTGNNPTASTLSVNPVAQYLKDNPRSPERAKSVTDFLNIAGKDVQDSLKDAYVRDKAAQATHASPTATPVEKATAGLSAVMGYVNAGIALSGAPAVFHAAESVPYVGAVAHTINTVFGGVGSAAGSLSGEAVDHAPLSPKTKETIKPLVQEISSLAAQIALGKGAEIAKKRVTDLSKTVTDTIKSDPVVNQGGKPTGLAGLLEQAQKPEVAIPKVDTTPQVIQDAKIKGVSQSMQEAVKTDPKTAIDKSLGEKNEYINGNSYAERQALAKDVIKPQIDKLGKLKDDEVLVFHNTPDGELKTDNYVSTNPEQMWMYADKNTIVKAVKKSDLVSTGVPEKDAFGERLYKPDGVSRTLKPAESTGEKLTSKLASGVEANAVEKKLTDTFGDLPEYNKVNMKEQADFATKLLAEDPEKARRIAMGEEVSPNHILPESVFTAVENAALKAGDVETLRDLATKSSLSTEATAMGQRIRALAERDPESPVAKIGEVQKERQKNVEKKLKGKTIKQAKKAEVENIKEHIKKTAPKKQEWADFIKEIQCGY